MKPTIVFVSPIAPSRTGNGLAMRMGQFSEALAKFARVHVIVIPAAGRPDYADVNRCADVSIHMIELGGRTDTQFSLLSRILDADVRLAAFRAYGKPSLSHVLSASVLGEVSALAKSLRPQAVLIGRSYLLPAIEALPDMPLAVDLDEDDFAALSERAVAAAREGRLHKAAWLAQESAACDALIGRYAGRLRAAFVSSDPERVALSRRFPGLPVDLAVNSIAIPSFFRKHEEGRDMLFVGSLGYAPNVEGLAWFAEKVAPRLSGCLGRLLVVGGGLPANAPLRRAPLKFVGPAPTVAPFYARAPLVIAPLLSGGGTRIKLLEAAAYRTAAVATSRAVAGLDWRAGWRADSPADFADACRIALSDRAQRVRRAEAGLQWVRRRHERAKIVAAMAVQLQERLS